MCQGGTSKYSLSSGRPQSERTTFLSASHQELLLQGFQPFGFRKFSEGCDKILEENKLISNTAPVTGIPDTEQYNM